MLIDQQRLHVDDMSENSALDNRELMTARVSGSVVAPGLDAESSGTSDEEKSKKKSGGFVNPLSKPKTIIDMDGNMSEGEWSSDNASADEDKRKKKEKKTLGKRKRAGGDVSDDDKVKGFFKSEAFEEVPVDQI